MITFPSVRQPARPPVRQSDFLALLFFLGAGILPAQPSSLLPVPRSIQAGEGRFVLDSTTKVAIAGFRDARLERAVLRAITRLEARLGAPMSRVLHVGGAAAGIVVRVTGAGQRVQGLDEDESYRLEVRSDGATISAGTVVGAIRALETFVQLVSSDAATHFVPAVTIDDAPRFAWRGLLVDVGRHFMSPEQIKRTLDGMAMVKLNVLHWHLSEDQGFRVESKRFPKLHSLGSDGLYYTQDQIRDIVAYARDRGIRVVPEFDMPGHSTSWFVGYPQYSAQRPPIAIRREWGGADAIFDPTRESVYLFIDRFIGEMVTLFPDAYWHIGGDEVEGKHWNSNPRIVSWRKQKGYSNNAALQAYFNKRLTRILAAHDRRMIGWDEILHPDLPKQTVVQSWRGTQYLAQATKQGYAGILSAPYYIDHIRPASEYYLADPLPPFDGLTPAQERLVMGGEACMWSEFITEETADSRIWPRLGAIAERFWSPREVTDVADMYRRLDILNLRLEAAGLRVLSHSTRMLSRIADAEELAPLELLLTAVEPPEFGQRLNGIRQDQRQPLTRLVDAARPDPPGRWATERLVRRVLASSADHAARDSLAQMFAAWSGLQPRLREIGSRSPLLAQAALAGDALARVAGIGTAALGYLGTGTPPPAGWAQPLVAELRQYEAPIGLLRVVIVHDVRRLVEAAAVGSR